MRLLRIIPIMRHYLASNRIFRVKFIYCHIAINMKMGKIPIAEQKSKLEGVRVKGGLANFVDAIFEELKEISPDYAMEVLGLYSDSSGYNFENAYKIKREESLFRGICDIFDDDLDWLLNDRVRLALVSAKDKDGLDWENHRQICIGLKDRRIETFHVLDGKEVLGNLGLTIEQDDRLYENLKGYHI